MDEVEARVRIRSRLKGLIKLKRLSVVEQPERPRTAAEQ